MSGGASKCDRACKDAQILRFFAKRPHLARTAAGQKAILHALLRRVGRLEAQVRSLESARRSPTGAIRHVFGRWASEALAVAWCESRYSVWARNGQYENLFQMGYHERQTYGWHTAGSPPLVAARAAYAYFAASGFDWSPWACKP